MSQHTPGPWRVCAEVGGGIGSTLGAAISDDTPEQNFIARIVRNDQLRDDYEGNARLIAAAPELLDALRELVQATPTPLHNDRQIAAFDTAVRLLGKVQR